MRSKMKSSIFWIKYVLLNIFFVAIYKTGSYMYYNLCQPSLYGMFLGDSEGMLCNILNHITCNAYSISDNKINLFFACFVYL